MSTKLMWRAIAAELVEAGINRPWLEQAAYMTGYNAARLTAYVGATTGIYAMGHKIWKTMDGPTLRKRWSDFGENFRKWKKHYTQTGEFIPRKRAGPTDDPMPWKKRKPPPPYYPFDDNPPPYPFKKKYKKLYTRYRPWRWIKIRGKWLKQHIQSGRISKYGYQ